MALRRDLRAPWVGPHALHGFIELVNRVLDQVDAAFRERIGVHTCPGNDRDSAHSADIDSAELIPELLGSTDDCGFSPYLVDDKPRHGSPDYARDVAFARIAARVRGTARAADELSGAA